jgi:ClpP class serine protease
LWLSTFLLNALVSRVNRRMLVRMVRLPALYALQRVLRKLPKGKDLVLIIQSHGGSIDTASAIASICRGCFDTFKVIVPFMAKSAATLAGPGGGREVVHLLHAARSRGPAGTAP